MLRKDGVSFAATRSLASASSLAVETGRGAGAGADGRARRKSFAELSDNGSSE